MRDVKTESTDVAFDGHEEETLRGKAIFWGQFQIQGKELSEDERNTGSVRKLFFYVVLVLVFGVLPALIGSYAINGQEVLTIKTLDGRRIQLPYQNSRQYKQSPIAEPSLQNIEFDNITAIEQMVAEIVTKEQKVEFSAKLFMNWFEDDETLYQMEYYRLNQAYNLDQQVTERRLCVMAPFRNLLKYGAEGSFKIFLKSLDGQNYSNYVVYMMDDASMDNSTEVVLAQLPHYPRLNNRLRIIRNPHPIGALGNRDSTTRNYCRPGDIVVDIDGDDSLVGRQTFNLLNRLYYNNPEAWFVYTNFISIKGEEGGDGRVISLNASKVQQGFCRTIQQKYFITNTYRTEISEWVTSELRSYLWDLYMKIPLEYLLQIETSKYYLRASDRFTMYAITELAGRNHTFFFDEYIYFYYQPNFKVIETISCTLYEIFYYEAQARILTPLHPLKSLSDQPERIQFYTIPKPILEFYITSQRKLQLCQEQLQGNSSVFEKIEQASE